MDSQFVLPAILLVVGGLSGAVGVEIIKTWRDKAASDLALFYPTWQNEMTIVRRELADLRELVIALSDELSSLGGDPTRVRVTLERQQRERWRAEAEAKKQK